MARTDMTINIRVQRHHVGRLLFCAAWWLRSPLLMCWSLRFTTIEFQRGAQWVALRSPWVVCK